MFSSLPADNNEVNRIDNIKEKQEYLEYENSCRFIRRVYEIKESKKIWTWFIIQRFDPLKLVYLITSNKYFFNILLLFKLFFKSEQNNSGSSRENLERATSSTATPDYITEMIHRPPNKTSLVIIIHLKKQIKTSTLMNPAGLPITHHFFPHLLTWF